MMAEKTVGMRLKEEVERIGNCARNSEDVFNVADAVWREIDNRQDRIAKLEQTIDGLCAANEQVNTLLGAEIERRELAEARYQVVLEEWQHRLQTSCKMEHGWCPQYEACGESKAVKCIDLLKEWVEAQAADALRKDGEAK